MQQCLSLCLLILFRGYRLVYQDNFYYSLILNDTTRLDTLRGKIDAVAKK